MSSVVRERISTHTDTEFLHVYATNPIPTIEE